MGGVIKVVIIKNGVVNDQLWSTSCLPDFVQNENFIMCNDSYIQEYIDESVDDDYDKTNLGFSPTCYGLDVFDFDKKVILTMQSYCGYRYIRSSDIILYCNQSKEYFDVVENMYNKNMLLPINVIHGIKHSFKICVDVVCKGEYVRGDVFKIKWEELGWKHILFSDDVIGSLKMYYYLQQSGYKICEEGWNKWFNK